MKQIFTILLLTAICSAQDKQSCKAALETQGQTDAEVAAKSSIEIVELEKRAYFFYKCASLYKVGEPENERYFSLGAVYDHASLVRMMDYFERHPEVWRQLFEEDQQGKR